MNLAMIRRYRILRWFALLAAALLPASPIWAQGCVLCYTSVANTGAQAMRGFEFGIIVLLIPALLLFSAIFLLILRRARAASRPTPAAKPVREGNYARPPLRAHGVRVENAPRFAR